MGAAGWSQVGKVANTVSGQRGSVSPVTADASASGRRLLRLAWISVALIPVAFVVGIFVGEGLLAVQGFESGSAEWPPVGATLLPAIPALLILIAPAVFAIVLGYRARRHGAGSGVVPAVIGVVAVAYVIIANSLPRILGA